MDRAKLPSCNSVGRAPDGNVCAHFVQGYCRQEPYCPYKSDKPLQEIAAQAEVVEIPNRMLDLLERIASGNVKIDETFIDSETFRAMYKAHEIVSTYDPTTENYKPSNMDTLEQLEADGLHLSAINVNLGRVLGQLQADVEGAKAYVAEIEAAKLLAIENSIRSGLRPGKITPNHVKALVATDNQVIEGREALLQARRRHLIINNLCERVESVINMVKKRVETLRREHWRS